MAEKKGIRFKGHETFAIREGWINKGIAAAEKNPGVFGSNFGADELGVGPNMAKAIRYWLKCAGLIVENPKKGVVLTGLGKLIWEYDSYIEDMFTLWILHSRIALNYEQATAWNLFFNRFGYEEFEKSDLVAEMKEFALLAAEELSLEKKISEKSIESDCDTILHMYVKRQDKNGTPEEKNVSPFGKLELIKNIDNRYVRKQPDLNRIPEEALLYLLAEYMQGKNSVHMEELLTAPNGPGRILQLKRNGLMELLEKLAAKDLIAMNRTAGLNMIYFGEKNSGSKMPAQEAVEMYYRATK